MNLAIDFDRIGEIFKGAESDGRTLLFEYETYHLLDNSGAESTPRPRLLPKATRISNPSSETFPGERAVLKIVSPFIVHKADAGGAGRRQNDRQDVLRLAAHARRGF